MDIRELNIFHLAGWWIIGVLCLLCLEVIRTDLLLALVVVPLMAICGLAIYKYIILEQEM